MVVIQELITVNT
ncbi:hypothetical protein FWK35_00030398 [Aphis craccivora]|uniref:Uncharacterized protein n=1 Tax=Aphis craccivora TaxID=307492 RepID=A0A6G0WIT1_APHCR|nr:hypothetical protein FWK35_00030398 [Aphis craccivora]